MIPHSDVFPRPRAGGRRRYPMTADRAIDVRAYQERTRSDSRSRMSSFPRRTVSSPSTRDAGAVQGARADLVLVNETGRVGQFEPLHQSGPCIKRIHAADNEFGCGGWTRTSDHLINNQALYQLSYTTAMSGRARRITDQSSFSSLCGDRLMCSSKTSGRA